MAKFLKSANLVREYLDSNKPEVVVIGRSNVGKSSLINAMAKAKIAKTSKTPGLTRLVNFFDFDKFILADLPGYGYANAGAKIKDQINNIIDEYFIYRNQTKLILQLCDCQVMTELDREMSIYFNKHNAMHVILLTKLDKVNKSFFDNNKHKISNFLSVPIENILPVSSKNNFNIDKVFEMIKKYI